MVCEAVHAALLQHLLGVHGLLIHQICLRIHFGECLHSPDIVLGRKPLAVVGGEAGKAEDGVLNLKEEDDESGLEMEEKLGSLLV